MSKSSVKSQGSLQSSTSKPSSSSLSKELQKKNEELQILIDQLKLDNEKLKEKLKLICKCIVDSVDMSQYEFIELNIVEPDEIDVKDLIHMVQQLALLSTQISKTDRIESHVEALEYRITELSKENSVNFKTKLKLQERLEFIMQERDVWKRNAETLKKMYAKLAKEREMENSQDNTKKCLIGTNQSNKDPKQVNRRVFSATIPRKYLDDIRNTNITDLQLMNVNTKLMENIKKLNTESNNLNSSAIETESIISLNNLIKDESSFSLFADTKSSANSSQTFFSPSTTNSQSLLKNKLNSTSNTSINESILNFQNSDVANDEKIVFIDTKSSNNSSKNKLSDNFFASENSESNGISKKFVSFNKDIDVRLYPKNTKLSNKIFEPLILPLAQQDTSSLSSSPTTSTPNSTTLTNSSCMNLANMTNETNHLSNQNQSNLHLSKSFNLNDLTQLFKLQNKDLIQNEKQPKIMNNNYKNEESNRFSNRASICSNRKLPGETSVKDLEPTLKMIIIKELSVDKLDGNDWRVFAKRIGISEQEIQNWTGLKLQFPMARVLSFWSSNPEATVRLLHRHLAAPCFNYTPLLKRIENFYDVY